VAELLNTAIEATIDAVSTELDPLAKIAKDAAAAAVLIAAGAAVIVGYLLFFNKLNNYTLQTLLAIKRSPLHITYISLIAVFIVGIIIKALGDHGDSVVRGGMPSIHAAISFGSTTAIAFITRNAVATTLALLMALLVTESRLEAGIHNGLEVAVGALLGILVTILIFQLAG
jgi:diacylglycerol kinase (ATP)